MWSRAALSRQGNDWVATVRNPASGSVSLRAEASNSTGSTVRQTIIRAYAVR